MAANVDNVAGRVSRGSGNLDVDDLNSCNSDSADRPFAQLPTFLHRPASLPAIEQMTSERGRKRLEWKNMWYYLLVYSMIQR